MVTVYDSGAYLLGGKEIVKDGAGAAELVEKKTGRRITAEQAKKGTMAFSILEQHNSSSSGDNLELRFDSLGAHDITYVGIIQTAKASGLEEFPVPFVLTNCHNSLCAVGGTINQDDHGFGLSAAKKYGGIFVPANLAVIHSFNREMMSRCGGMILCSDSHTRYGALGTMGVGEGGGELAKQLLGRAYEVGRPEVIGVYLTGKPQKGVGPQDVALSIIGKVYKNSYVKNKVMEFVGDGVANLDVDFRNGIDVMTTETACWSSIWTTDGRVREYYEAHGRPQDYRELAPQDVAYYDGLVHVDLSTVEPSIALPFHPSNVYTLREFRANAADLLREIEKNLPERNAAGDGLAGKLRNGEFYVDQGVIAGCSGGTFGNLTAAADLLEGKSVGGGAFQLSVYPDSQPDYLALVANGTVARLMKAGAVVHTAFCGPCFGACDTPADRAFSIRHTTRNFPHREGSKPGDGQLSYVALMDARSIAATAANGGRLTAATEVDCGYTAPKFYFDRGIYDRSVYNGFGRADPGSPLVYGPNIKDWPEIPALTEHLLLKVVSFITDPVTTTDELIPSGETSSYRSNPLRLAEFTLGRKDPEYVPAAKAVREAELKRESGAFGDLPEEFKAIFGRIRALDGFEAVGPETAGIGSAIFANRPGDGSAREQAASCQRILGGWANLCREYATKRYRSNLINWGMVPFTVVGEPAFRRGEFIFVPDVAQKIREGRTELKAYVIGEEVCGIALSTGSLTESERDILLSGCLINYYRKH